MEILARASRPIDPAAAESQTRQILALALARQDYRAASAAVGALAEQCRRTLRLAEALRLAKDKRGFPSGLL